MEQTNVIQSFPRMGIGSFGERKNAASFGDGPITDCRQTEAEIFPNLFQANGTVFQKGGSKLYRIGSTQNGLGSVFARVYATRQSKLYFGPPG